MFSYLFLFVLLSWGLGFSAFSCGKIDNQAQRKTTQTYKACLGVIGKDADSNKQVGYNKHQWHQRVPPNGEYIRTIQVFGLFAKDEDGGSAKYEAYGIEKHGVVEQWSKWAAKE